MLMWHSPKQVEQIKRKLISILFYAQFAKAKIVSLLENIFLHQFLKSCVTCDSSDRTKYKISQLFYFHLERFILKIFWKLAQAKYFYLII